MRRLPVRGAFAVAAALLTTTAVGSPDPAAAQAAEEGEAADGDLPRWAYPLNTADRREPAGEGSGFRLPGSDRAYTWSELRNPYDVADWRPDLHPPMPDVVRHGREGELRGCGFCHYPNGQGRPENAGVAGLPTEYIIQQVRDFRAGLRESSEPEMGPPNAMIQDAKAVTDEELRVAAEYFSQVEFRPWIRVVEADSVPEMEISGWMHVPVAGGGMEPLGDRIVETPEDPERALLRDPASGFVAYVPVGSVARGEELVRTGGDGRTVPCGTCHGADLKGLGPIPGIAGRSPSYLVRQLYDLQTGSRRGAWSDLMREAVDNLTVQDMLEIAAYAASLEP